MITFSHIQGCEYLLRDIRRRNDLGHPLCSNLREGTWLAGYLLARIKDCEEFQRLGQWLQPLVENLEIVPGSYRPVMFAAIVHALYSALYERAIECEQ